MAAASQTDLVIPIPSLSWGSATEWKLVANGYPNCRHATSAACWVNAAVKHTGTHPDVLKYSSIPDALISLFNRKPMYVPYNDINNIRCIAISI